MYKQNFSENLPLFLINDILFSTSLQKFAILYTIFNFHFNLCLIESCRTPRFTNCQEQKNLQIFKLKDLYVQKEWYSILYRQLNNSCTLNTHTNMKSCSILKATYFSAQFFCIKMVNTSTLYYCINSTQKLKLPEKLRYTL